MKHFFLLLIILLYATAGFSQQIKITGKVADNKTGAPQAFANVVVKGTTVGATTDINGQFELQVDFGEAETIVLVCSYVGYGSQELVVNKNSPSVEFKLAPIAIMAKEVVISASRVSESLMEAPVAIQKISAEKIADATSGDFYQNLGNLQGIDVVSSSFGFKTINSRGFNTTSPVRSVQFVDGMDNQAPGLNFPAGNLIGASDIDLAGVEVVSGASSALYGPNAMQGIVNMTTKDPFNYPGLEVMLKGGERNMMNAQFRFAQIIGEKKRFGFKITGDFLKAKDWIPDDTVVNRYGKIEATVNLREILHEKEKDSTLSQEDRDKIEGLNTYLSFNEETVSPKSITVKAPGYMERDLLINDDARSTKASAGLYYKLTDSLQLSYIFKYGEATAVYQGTNRYSIRDIRFYQHKIELSGQNFFVKAYTTMENAGSSYDMGFTAVNISKDGIKNYVSNYLKEYIARLDTLTKKFTEEGEKWMSDTAHKYAYAASQNSWLVPGTTIYDSTFRSIISNPDLKKGSLFVDRSAFHHAEAQYNFQLGSGSLVAGANYRLYNPKSFGTIFSDTLVNSADTMSDGRADPAAQYVKLSVYEIGGYLQMVNRLIDDKLKFTSSVRFDKSQNYKLQYSPRFSIVFTQNDHSFRLSWQQAFRAPTLQDQYLLLDVGPITLSGNLLGETNAYTQQSVIDYNKHHDTANVVKPSLLKHIIIAPIQPENVETIEAGYRGAVAKGLYADITCYYSVYTNFIGSMRVYKALGSAKAGEESGDDAMLNPKTNKNITRRLYQFPVNASSKVPAWGATAGLIYYYKSYAFSGNYTYSDLDTMKLSESGIIPGFNTPRHKFNLGVEAKQIWEGLGFGVTHRFIADKYRWQSTFGDGDVPAYSIFDAQVSYNISYIKSILRVGASNVFDSPVRTAYGSPAIGRLVYTSWTFKL